MVVGISGQLLKCVKCGERSRDFVTGTGALQRMVKVITSTANKSVNVFRAAHAASTPPPVTPKRLHFPDLDTLPRPSPAHWGMGGGEHLPAPATFGGFLAGVPG